MKNLALIMAILLSQSSIGQKTELKKVANKNDTIFSSIDKSSYKVKKYDEDGSLKFLVFYAQNLEKRYIKYSKDGSKLEEVFFSRDGEVAIKNYFNIGILEKKEFYLGKSTYKDTISNVDQEFACYDLNCIEYYPNGKVNKEYSLFCNKFTGEFREYYESGNLKKKGYYYYGIPKGIFYTFDSNGYVNKVDSLFK